MQAEQTNQAPRFWRSSLCYLLGSTLSKLAVFFMLPVYTARIPSADMGTYDTAVAVAILVSSVLFLDIGVGLMRFMLEEKGAGEDASRVLASGLFLMFLSGFLYAGGCGVAAFFLEIPYYPLIVLYGLLNAVMMALGYVARAEGHHAFFALSGAVSTLLQVAVNLVLILGLGMGYQSLYVAFCIGAGVCILMLALRCRVFSVCRWRLVSSATCRRLLAFCLPLGLNSAAFWLLNSLNRVLVTACLGAEANGYYAVSLKFTQILVFVSTCFQFAWQEVSFAKGFDEGAESCRYYSEKTDLFLRIFMAILLLLLPAIRVGLWLFPGFIHDSYAEAVRLLPLAFFGAFLSVFSSFLDPIFGAARKTGVILFSTLAGALINVTVILTLFRLGFGVEAANIAFLCGWAVTVTIRLIVLCRGARLRLRLWHLLWFLPLAALVALAFSHLAPVWNAAVLLGMLPIAVAVLLPELRLMHRALSSKLRKRQ
ncbi:MAG: hypothetical protein E7644_08705 [Ruminococcaceae bacterium]|nr:hypothetical protein [Oscillospiraceae bacterium]